MPLTSAHQRIATSIRASMDAIGSMQAQLEQIDVIAQAVVRALLAGGKVLTAGHGGSAADALHMAEELVGRPVDFVLRHSLEKSPNRFAREHILATAVCLYGN